MRTAEEAEEVVEEIKNKLGILQRYLEITIEQDCYCDGSGWYVRID